MYTLTITCPYISLAVGMLSQYQSSLWLNHWKVAKKVMHYLQDTKGYMFTYKHSGHIKIIDYSD